MWNTTLASKYSSLYWKVSRPVVYKYFFLAEVASSCAVVVPLYQSINVPTICSIFALGTPCSSWDPPQGHGPWPDMPDSPHLGDACVMRHVQRCLNVAAESKRPLWTFAMKPQSTEKCLDLWFIDSWHHLHVLSEWSQTQNIQQNISWPFVGSSSIIVFLLFDLYSKLCK